MRTSIPGSMMMKLFICTNHNISKPFAHFLQNTPKKIYVLFFFTNVSIENKKSISFDILEDTLKVYLSVAFLKTQKVFL